MQTIHSVKENDNIFNFRLTRHCKERLKERVMNVGRLIEVIKNVPNDKLLNCDKDQILIVDEEHNLSFVLSYYEDEKFSFPGENIFYNVNIVTVMNKPDAITSEKTKYKTFKLVI